MLISTVLIAPMAQANTSFDTTPSWNSSDSIAPFGNPDTTTYGETFICPVDNVLNDFTFYIKPDSGVSLSVKAYVYQWSGSLFGGGGGGAVGSSMFASGSSMIINDDTMFNPVTVNTGGTTLTAGGQYVAFLTVSNPSDYSDTTGTSVWGMNLYSHVSNDGSGGFVFYNNGNNFSALNSNVWDNFADFGDLAWKANFSAGRADVPEPGSVASMIGISVFGAGIVRRRRSK